MANRWKCEDIVYLEPTWQELDIAHASNQSERLDDLAKRCRAILLKRYAGNLAAVRIVATDPDSKRVDECKQMFWHATFEDAIEAVAMRKMEASIKMRRQAELIQHWVSVRRHEDN